MKTLTSLALVGTVAAVTLTSVSSAQAGPDGLSLGIERAFGYQLTSATADNNGVKSTSSVSEFTLGLGSSSARVGVDYVTRSGLTLGTGFGYGTGTVEIDSDGGATSKSSSDAFLIAPRVGSLMMFTSDVGLWPRGGLTYQTQTLPAQSPLTGASADISTRQFLLTLEAPLVIMPSSFGFSLAPTFDYVLSNTTEVDGTKSDADVSGYQFGITFGVFGIL